MDWKDCIGIRANELLSPAPPAQLCIYACGLHLNKYINRHRTSLYLMWICVHDVEKFRGTYTVVYGMFRSIVRFYAIDIMPSHTLSGVFCFKHHEEPFEPFEPYGKLLQVHATIGVCVAWWAVCECEAGRKCAWSIILMAIILNGTSAEKETLSSKTDSCCAVRLCCVCALDAQWSKGVWMTTWRQYYVLDQAKKLAKCSGQSVARHATQIQPTMSVCVLCSVCY